MSGQAAPAQYTLRVYLGSDWHWDFKLKEKTTGLPMDTTGLELKLDMKFCLADNSSEVVKLRYPGTGITALDLPTASFRAFIVKTDLVDFVPGECGYNFDWRAGGIETRYLEGVIEVYEGIDPND